MKNYFPFQLIRDLARWWRAVGVGAQGCTDGGLAGYFRPLQVLSPTRRDYEPATLRAWVHYSRDNFPPFDDAIKT